MAVWTAILNSIDQSIPRCSDGGEPRHSGAAVAERHQARFFGHAFQCGIAQNRPWGSLPSCRRPLSSLYGHAPFDCISHLCGENDPFPGPISAAFSGRFLADGDTNEVIEPVFWLTDLELASAYIPPPSPDRIVYGPRLPSPTSLPAVPFWSDPRLARDS
jgi:hypothetical protein